MIFDKVKTFSQNVVEKVPAMAVWRKAAASLSRDPGSVCVWDEPSAALAGWLTGWLTAGS